MSNKDLNDKDLDKAWHLLKAGAITNLLCSDVTARASRLQRAIALSGGGDDAAQQSPRPMCVEPQSAPPDREAGAPPPGAPKSNGWGSALLRPQPSASSCAGFQMPIAPIPGARDAPPQSNGWGLASICPQTSASSCAGFQLPIPPIPPAIPIGAPPVSMPPLMPQSTGQDPRLGDAGAGPSTSASASTSIGVPLGERFGWGTSQGKSNGKQPVARGPPRRSRSRSPLKRSRSPLRRSKSPLKRSRSPLRRSRSPLRRSRSPLRRSRSPKRRSRSPQGRRRERRHHEDDDDARPPPKGGEKGGDAGRRRRSDSRGRSSPPRRRSCSRGRGSPPRRERRNFF